MRLYRSMDSGSLDKQYSCGPASAPPRSPWPAECWTWEKVWSCPGSWLSPEAYLSTGDASARHGRRSTPNEPASPLNRLHWGTRRGRWLRHILPILAFEGWGWLWSDTAGRKVTATVNGMICDSTGLCKLEEECWRSWHARMLRDAISGGQQSWWHVL